MMVRDVVYPEAQPAFNLFIYLTLALRWPHKMWRSIAPRHSPPAALECFWTRASTCLRFSFKV